MFISRVPLSLTRLEAIAFASSPYRLHAAVERSFSPDAVREGEGGRILWRLDEVPGDASKAWLYVVSPERPEFSLACEQAGWPEPQEWVSKDYSPVLRGISEGQVWQFRLKANPVRKVLVDKGRREREGVVGTFQGHVTEAQQRSWLLDRAEKNGFRVAQTAEGFDRLVVSNRRREQFRRRDGVVTLSTAQYDGVLEVTDADRFRHTLSFGLGRARGFGCGLMTIAPTRGSEHAE